MARIRALKPGFFKHADLYDAEKASGLPLRVAYAGLWCVADREGRFKWKPREIKTDVLPYDDVDMCKVLDALETYRFIFRYKCAGEDYGYIPSFLEHQHVNKNEAPSTIPAPPKNSNARAKRVNAPKVTVVAPSKHHEELVSGVQGREQEGKGTEVERAVRAAPTKGTRWPPDKVVPEDWITDADIQRHQHDLPRIDLRLEATRFANYWAARTRDAARGNWHKTWINWALDDSKRKIARVSNHDKGTEGAAIFLAKVERGEPAGHRDRAGEVGPGPRLLEARHGPEKVGDAVRDLQRRPEGPIGGAASIGMQGVAQQSRQHEIPDTGATAGSVRPVQDILDQAARNLSGNTGRTRTGSG